MLVRADRIFVTASPLSELVWSPRKGLSLKCTDSSSAENQTSLWWSTESFNVITTAPEGGGTDENIGNGMPLKKAIDPSMPDPNCNVKNMIDVNSPSRSVAEIVPVCPTMAHEQNSANDALEVSSGELEISPERNERSVAEAISENNDKNIALEDTKMSGSSLGNSKRNASPGTNTAERVSSQGHNNANDTISLSSSHVQTGTGHAEPKKEKLPENAEDIEKGGTHALNNIVLHRNTLENPVCHLQCIDSKSSWKGSDASGDFMKLHMHPRLTYFNASGEAADHGIVGLSDNRKGEDQNICLPYRSTMEGLRIKEDVGKSAKGKEKIDLFAEDVNMGMNRRNIHISKERDDSNESVKSSNEEFTAGKRLRCFQSKETPRKKLKQMNHESCFDGILPKQDSSFLNWISGFAKALPCPAQVEAPLALVSRSSHSKALDIASTSSLDGGVNSQADKVGFQSFIEALHYPKFMMRQIISSNVNELHKCIQSTELQAANKQSVSAGGSVFHISTMLDMHRPVPLPAFELENRSEETPPDYVMNSASDFNAQGKQNHAGLGNHEICNLRSSSSSIRITSVYHGNTETGRPDPIVHGSNVLVVNGGSELLRSFWITRLCSKPTQLSLFNQVNQAVTSARRMQLEGGNPFLPRLPNENAPFEGNKCSGNICISLIEDRKNAMEKDEHSPGNSNSSSKGITTGEKPKAKLNPILPSRRIKQLEPMTSVFAKRLDAFRHIKPSNILSEVLYTASICFFCGQSGHCMKDCSQVVGSELENLQRNINLYDGPKDSVCLCIRCFQLNHWAIECPYSSRRTNSPASAFPSIAAVNFEKGDVQLVTEDSRRSERNFREYPQNATRTIGVEQVKYSHPKPIKEFPGAGYFKGKTILASSVHSDSRGNQVAPTCVFPKRKVFDEQARIFEGIRGLRLSRTNLIRLIKAPISGCSLEGFFLRVRLGKEEEIHEGSGYQVACISGAPEDKSFGTTKHQIPVNIDGFKCLLDCHFVSNNDFSEDELNAWWSTVSRSGIKPPKEEQLMRKLQERKRFGF